jgi:hypothetical protein
LPVRVIEAETNERLLSKNVFGRGEAVRCFARTGQAGRVRSSPRIYIFTVSSSLPTSKRYEYIAIPVEIPVANLIHAGRFEGERKPSIVPARISKTEQPMANRAASRPFFFKASTRVRSPGLMSE